MNFDAYDNPLAYPARNLFTVVHAYKGGKLLGSFGGISYTGKPGADAADDARRAYPDAVFETEFNETAYRAAQNTYNDDTNRLIMQFRADLLAEHGVTNHPKADKVYALAWQYGHSAGLSEVANYFSDLVEIIQ